MKYGVERFYFVEKRARGGKGETNRSFQLNAFRECTRVDLFIIIIIEHVCTYLYIVYAASIIA